MNKWQTIDTAPKDGTLIIVMYMRMHTPFVYSARWDGDVWLAHYTTDMSMKLDHIFAPTHWMALPPPPKREKNELATDRNSTNRRNPVYRDSNI
jgi:hypothetical protein